MKKAENPIHIAELHIPASAPGGGSAAPVIADLIRFGIDASLRFQYIEPHIEEITGYSASDLVKVPSKFLNIVSNVDRNDLRNSLLKSIEEGDYFSARFRIITASGTEKWLWMRGPSEIGDGGARSIRGVISDISAQELLERDLRMEREFFRAFADTLDDGICVLSDDFHIQFMNRSMIDLVGNHEGEVCYKALFMRDGCCPLPADASGDHFESCGFHENQPGPGGGRTFHIRTLPISVPGGFRGRIGQFRDITKLKTIEHKFRDFAVRVRAITRAANMADLGIFILVDQDGIEARFKFANQAFCRLTGYNFDELVSMRISDVIHPDDLDAAMDRYRRRLRGEPMSDTYEIQLVRKDQVSITVFFMGAISIHHGRNATVGFVRDITARKQLQESLALSQRLASIGKLSAEIAHEINNPLTSILAFNKLLEKIIQQQPFPVERLPEIQDYIRYVNSEASRCAEISRNLLNFSRTTEIRIKEHNIHEIVGKTVDILRHKAEMSNITIDLQFSPEIPPVHCDFTRMQQALMNLLWNAIEAMPEGGTLTVSTSYQPQPTCTQLCKSGENMVQVTITDTGIGIPKDNMDRIFEPFFSTKKEKSGVGLGLSVAYGIVRKHNGQIRVQSESGVGTSFLVQIPTAICMNCPFRDC